MEQEYLAAIFGAGTTIAGVGIGAVLANYFQNKRYKKEQIEKAKTSAILLRYSFVDKLSIVTSIKNSIDRRLELLKSCQTTPPNQDIFIRITQDFNEKGKAVEHSLTHIEKIAASNKIHKLEEILQKISIANNNFNEAIFITEKFNLSKKIILDHDPSNFHMNVLSCCGNWLPEYNKNIDRAIQYLKIALKEIQERITEPLDIAKIDASKVVNADEVMNK